MKAIGLKAILALGVIASTAIAYLVISGRIQWVSGGAASQNSPTAIPSPQVVSESSPMASSSGTQDKCHIEKLQNQLSTDSSARVQSMITTIQNFKTFYQSVVPGCESDIFEIFWKFYNATSDEVSGEDGDILEQEAKKLKVELSSVGWTSFNGEDGTKISRESGWMAMEFGSHLPLAWKKFLALEESGILEGIRGSDGEDFAIEWSELGSRISSVEKFLLENNDFPLAERLREIQTEQVKSFLSGGVYAPIFKDDRTDVWPKSFEDKPLAAYRLFLEENQNSKYKNLIGGYLKIIEKNKLIISKDVEEQLRNYRAHADL